jgi:hypothetical protein
MTDFGKSVMTGFGKFNYLRTDQTELGNAHRAAIIVYGTINSLSICQIEPPGKGKSSDLQLTELTNNRT